MRKKEFIVILVLSVVVTYGLAIFESSVDTSANKSGLPFKFGTYSLFGEASTNYLLLLLDFIFWFLVIWGIWKALQKIKKR